MIALAQIIADFEPVEYIKRCWDTVLPYVEGSFITINGKTKTETKEAKALKQQLMDYARSKGYPTPVFSYTKWNKDFAEARQFNFNQVPKDFGYILWLDADDVLRGGKNLKEVERTADEKGFNCVFFNYLYKVEVDEEGKIHEVLIEHLRDRFIKNDNSYKWNSPIHENLIPLKDPKMTDSQLCDVVHLSTDDRAISAITRNIEILEKQLEKEGDKQDPRTIYYLAKAYFDLRTPEMWDKSKVLLYKYLQGSDKNTPSGWAEERAQAWEYLSEIYRDRKEYNLAVKALHNALIEDPKFPNFYIDMAIVMASKGDWAKAKHWAMLSQAVPYPKTTLVTNPKDMKARLLEVLFHVALNTNNIEEASALATKLAELFPEDPTIKARAESLLQVRHNNEIGHYVIRLAQYLNERGEIDRIQHLIRAIPREIEEEPIFVGLRRDFTPARKWERNEIAIYCGKGFEPWSPRNLSQGIGGSEEAVIYLSNELSRMGWKVTVYGDPQGAEGEYNGVLYLPYFKFNPQDIFNILIGWRNVGLFDTEWKAQKTYLWLHDIQNPNEYSDVRVDRIDKIFALSKWHRDNLPNVEDDKFMLTGNGINVADFENLEKIERDPHKMFYGSSYDRGLEHLLEMWPEIKKAVPDAKLSVCYGWKLFESFYFNNPERMAWKAKMDKLMEQDGITHLGRVSQLDVLREQFSSGIWAYPTHFGEISCITAMKSQAAGAIPVVTDYAALEETVKYGYKVKVDDPEDIYTPKKREEFVKYLVNALQNVEWQEKTRAEMMPWAREKFGWETIAKQWDKEFERDYVKEAMDVVVSWDPSLEKFMPIKHQKEYGLEETY